VVRGATAESVALNYGPDRQRWYQYYSGNGATESTYYAGPLEIVTSGSVTSFRHYIYAGNEQVAVYSRSSSGNAVDLFYLTIREASQRSRPAPVLWP
jgi:hypothetical protein